MDRLEAVLPRHIRFHLFGVKGAVAIALRGHPRVLSLDSQAYDAAAREEARKLRRADPAFSCSIAFRSQHMRRWFGQLTAGISRTPPLRKPTQFEMYLEAAE